MNDGLYISCKTIRRFVSILIKLGDRPNESWVGCYNFVSDSLTNDRIEDV